MKKKLVAVVFSLTLLAGVLMPSSVVCAALESASCNCYKGAGTHDYVLKKPSCTENGITWQICNSCGDIVRYLSIPKLGHTYSAKGLWNWCDRCGHNR